MATQKQCAPSFATILSVLSIGFYCAGFLRVEVELNKQKKRINALENVAETGPPSSELHSDSMITNNSQQVHRNGIYKRQVDSINATSPNSVDPTMHKINKLLSSSEGKVQLCHSKGVTCSLAGPPGPPGPRGEKGARGRRGHRGKPGNKGDQGIMGSPGKSGKQGIMGPVGLAGEAGPKGQKGDMGPAGMPGSKGEPGESISAPSVAVSPARSTVNESGSVKFQCSATGNPRPSITWSKLNSQTKIRQSAVAGGTLLLKNLKGGDAGVYKCSAVNILGQAHAVGHLVVNVRPSMSLNPGPFYFVEGSNASLPACHVTGHPAPLVTWSKSFGRLPQGRVHSNNSVIKLFGVRKADSDNYLCTATNLLGSVVKRTHLVVISLPQFTVKPPSKVTVLMGETLTLNCSATGDPEPAMNWKKQEAQLPVGRSQQINGGLVIRNIKKEDAGIYICAATIAGVFQVETVTTIDVLPSKDCSDLLKSGYTQNGVYSINPDGRGSFNVYCDMRTDGGGWTVFQRRQDGSVDFYRGWNDYKSGFGQLTTEFWLGNDRIHRLTAARPSTLRVELEDWNGVRVYAKYGKFKVGDEQAKYRLEVGSYSGTAGDSLAYHNNMAFSTKDRDNDNWSSNCAVSYTGAWWYGGCHYSNLNGKYLGRKSDNVGARWYHFRGALSLKFTEMKLRPSS